VPVGARLAEMTANLTDPRSRVPTAPSGYERRTTAFLDQALGLKETS
jgi:hypothetical protein